MQGGSSMANWYYAQGQQQAGPVSELELGRLLQTGQIPFNTPVWTDGMPDWAAANTIPSLFSGAPPGPNAAASPIPSVPQSGVVFAGYAGFWKRFVALVVDTIVFLIVIYAFLMAMLAVIAVTGTGEVLLNLLIRLAAFILGWLYFAGFESSTWRATPGKRLLGIVVVDLEGRRISFARATGRHFAKYLSQLILFIGFIMAGFTERKQGLHDMIAGCLVVNKP